MTQILARPAIDEQTVELPQSKRIVWIFFAFAAITVILVAAVCWSLAHPYGIHWDESQYLNDIQMDGQRLRTGHLQKLAGSILIKNFRPPAYRLLAFPLIGVFGYHTTEARLISLACFVLSAFFVYLSVRRISTPEAGAIAALIFALSPEVVSASIFFSTDTPLYLATAAMLYYVFVSWSEGEQRASTWVGLGSAVGLGLLAKTSFILIALPVFAFWFAASHWRLLKIPRLISQRRAGALVFLIAGPWWLLNAKDAIAYGRYARGFVRGSLGQPSLATWERWFNTVLQCLLGHGLSLMIALVLVTYLVRIVIVKKAILGGLQFAALGACACAGVPLVLTQLSGTNYLLRHISPAVVPLAVGVGILAGTSGWTRSRIALSVSAILICTQLIMLIFPVVHPNKEPVDLGFINGALPWRTMSRFDQWDWRPVLNLADRCGADTPAISFFGGGRNLNPPQIQFPWVVRATSTRAMKLAIPNVTWLWRSEEGSVDWQAVMDLAHQSDMVITAPRFVGEVKGMEDPDNLHNAEFEARLAKDPGFQGPFRFEMGRFQPIDVDVFVKKSLSCH